MLLNPYRFSAGLAPAESVSFISSSARVIGTSASSVSVLIPALTQIGDLMVMSVNFYQTLTAPAGWTQYGSTQTISTTRRLAHYYKITEAGEPGFSRTWTQGANNYINYSLSIWRGGAPLAIKAAVTGGGTGVTGLAVQTSTLLTNGRVALVAYGAQIANTQFPCSWTFTASGWTFIGGGSNATEVQRSVFAYKPVTQPSDVGGTVSFAPDDLTSDEWQSTTLVIGYA